MLDACFWDAATIVMDFVWNEGCSKRVRAYHDRGIRQLADHLDSIGAECTKEAIDQWLCQGKRQWSKCRFKENRITAYRLIDALETGSVRQSSYSHPGPTDYSKLSGWSKDSVDAYAHAAEIRFSEQEGYLSKTYASQFLVRTGLQDARPKDLTAELIVGYVKTCDGAKGVRAARLSHVRGFLTSLAEREEIPWWAPMLASDRFASMSECYTDFCAPDENGADPLICLEQAGPFADALHSIGYAKTTVKTALRVLGMLYIAFSLNNVSFTLTNALYWLERIAHHIGAQKQTYARMIRLFYGFANNGSVDTAIAKSSADPLSRAPAWAKDMLAAYLDLKAREGCLSSTVGCIRRACLRMVRYADSVGIRSWADIDAVTVSAWCIDDPHETAEGRACYIGKVRGLLQYLGDRGATSANVWLSARSSHAPAKHVVEILSDAEISAAQAARLAAKTPMQLRDAAIVALGLTMGLRSCDVVNIRMSDISWSSSSITIIQKKTCVQLTLPLSAAAGNAIAAYIKNGRPSTGSLFLFVKHRAPYDGLNKRACRDAIVRTFGTHVAGFHILRKTFATFMLCSGANKRQVSEALGHTTELSMAPYLSLDSTRMRMCALSPAECGIGEGHE